MRRRANRILARAKRRARQVICRHVRPWPLGYSAPDQRAKRAPNPVRQNREDDMIVRRDLLKGASLLAVTAAASGLTIPSADAQQVPNSTGTEQPKLKAP